MLKCQIKIDLPSVETERQMGALERMRSLLGAEIDLKSGQEELTVGAMTLIRGIIEGFRAAGIGNAIIFLIDKKVDFLGMKCKEISEKLPVYLLAFVQ